jgi:hypothetical protein
MNHLGDTNKMVSETPRMKAAVMAAMEHGTGNVYRVGCDIERELNAANDGIKRLEEENNELRAEEACLLNTNGELERRIKRLIDAGDAMFPWSERVGQEFWTKAKEAKL